jgi:hypothetical protein
MRISSSRASGRLLPLLCGIAVAGGGIAWAGPGDYRFAPWGSGGGYGPVEPAPWNAPVAGPATGFSPPVPGAAPYSQYRFRDAPEIPRPAVPGLPKFRPFGLDGKGYPQVPPGYGWQGGEGGMGPPPVFRPLETREERPSLHIAPPWGEGAAPYPALPRPWDEPRSEPWSEPWPERWPEPWSERRTDPWGAPDYASPYPSW